MKVEFNHKIRLLQLVNHLAMFVGIAAVVMGKASPWYVLAGGIAYVWFVLIGTNIGLHRYFSHRSFQASLAWQYVMAWSGTICSVGTIIGWAGLHRYHHRHTDTVDDPYDPQRIGLFRAWFYLWDTSKFTKKFIRKELGDKSKRLANPS
jgi:fatty-acid desaturase